MLNAVLVISGHELRGRLRDGTAWLIALLAPILLATLFGIALGGDDDPPLEANIGFVDLDGGEFPSSVRTEALESEELQGMLTFTDIDSTRQARAAVDEGTVGAAIVFPSGFSDSVGAGEGGEVVVLRTAEAPLAGTIATALVDQISALVDARTLAAKASLRAGVPPDDVKEYVEANGADGPSLQLRADPLTSGKVDLTVYYGSGMAALFAFFVAGSSARSLLTERHLGTLRRVRAAPVPLWTPVAGKALVAFLLALTSMCATWIASSLIFGVSWGDPLAVFALCAAHAFTATAIVMLVASQARTDAQADGYTMAVAFVLAFLGGSLVPVYNLPGFLQGVAQFTPNGWVSTGLSELASTAGGIGAVLTPLSVVAAIGAVAAVLAAIRLRKGVLA